MIRLEFLCIAHASRISTPGIPLKFLNKLSKHLSITGQVVSWSKGSFKTSWKITE